MASVLLELHFAFYAPTENWVDSSKDEAFFKRSIIILPKKWKKIVGSDGKYYEYVKRSRSFAVHLYKSPASYGLLCEQENVAGH